MNTNNETIYHYTNLNAFKSIIETGEIWFTRVDCLNDSSEYVYYKDVFNKAREEFIQEQNVTTKYDLKLLNEYVEKYLINARSDFYRKTFTFSLSTNGDSIPMWNYYSNKTGISIGFNSDKVINLIGRKVNNYYAFSPGVVEYNELKQINSIKYWLFEILKIANNPKLLTNPDISVTLDEVNQILAPMWHESNLLKESSFEYEDEFRISLSKLDINIPHDQFDKVHWIVTDNNIKPVIKIKVTENWNDIITNIVISPYNQSKMIKDNIHEFLISNGINIDESMIVQSKCPVRNL